MFQTKKSECGVVQNPTEVRSKAPPPWDRASSQVGVCDAERSYDSSADRFSHRSSKHSPHASPRWPSADQVSILKSPAITPVKLLCQKFESHPSTPVAPLVKCPVSSTVVRQLSVWKPTSPAAVAPVSCQDSSPESALSDRKTPGSGRSTATSHYCAIVAAKPYSATGGAKSGSTGSGSFSQKDHLSASTLSSASKCQARKFLNCSCP